MAILVDTSVWVDYFRSGRQTRLLDELIDDNLIVTNDLILAELIPFLELRNQQAVIGLLQVIDKAPLHINWEEIISFQTRCLQKGANGIGIPDLIIAQNARQHDHAIYSLDKHFQLLNQVLDIPLVQH